MIRKIYRQERPAPACEPASRASFPGWAPGSSDRPSDAEMRPGCPAGLGASMLLSRMALELPSWDSGCPPAASVLP